MKKVLVFKTSTDATIKNLFHDLDKENIDCLIPSSQLIRYQKEFPYIHFIDICRESFYDLPDEVIGTISKRHYDQLYVTFSGMRGHNYGNVMELVSMVTFKQAFFYNCNAEKIKIPRKNPVRDYLCRAYITTAGFIYGLRSGR